MKKAGNDWTIKDEGLNIKQGDEKKYEKLKKASGYTNGKIKVYDGQSDYYQGFKFSIEEGDFTLASGKSGDTNVTLGTYETYEIKKDGDGNWYLTRVKDSRDAIKTSLGLPCDLPADSKDSVECTGTINSIKFSGGDATITGTPKLTIHKEEFRQHYPLGYRFSFTSGSDSTETSITIGGEKTVLKQGVKSDFKIKLEEGGNMSLEGWTLEALMKEIDFKKEGEDWTLGDGTMNIKQEERKSTLVRKKGDPSGKIKLQKEVPGYNQGFKFSIEGGNINLEEDSSISVLSKYETYEVSLDPDGYFYFSRKKKAIEVIKEKLGIPADCAIPSQTTKDPTCELTSEKLKLIKFDGKGDSDEVTINGGSSVTMKIERGESGIFPFGYKFTLISDKEITFSGSSPSTIKANTNTEFKIKESGGKFTLERAWDAGKLAGKVGLTKCGSEEGSTKCSFGATISVWDSDESYAENAVITTPEKKITYEEGHDNYNQGIKFFVEEEISLAGKKGSTNKPTKIEKKTDDTPTYEIAQKTVENNTKWYLVKKGG